MLKRTPRREFLKGSIGAATAWSAVTAQSGERRVAKRTEADFLHWQTHQVAEVPAGYQVAVADVNGDGQPDLIGLSTQERLIAWYENPVWQRRPISRNTESNICLAPLATRHGLTGLAFASDFHLEDSTRGGDVWWATPGRSLDAEWDHQTIARIPASHRLRWGNITGDGRLRLVDAPIIGYGAHEPDYSVPTHLTWFDPPASVYHKPAHGGRIPQTGKVIEWPSHLIDASLTVLHGLLMFDWDDDGRDEILTASFEGVHLFHSHGPASRLTWTRTQLAAGDQAPHPRRGSSEIGVGQVAGRRFLATIEPWHGEQVVVYSAPAHGSGLWQRQVIDSSFKDGHALVCADLDGDGSSEIVAGYRGPGTALYVYYAADESGSDWLRQTLDTNMSASCVAVEDMNGDGLPDLVCIGASTGNLKWYQNLGRRL